MPPKEIHEDFMETFEKESPSNSTVKKWATYFKRGGGGERESVEDVGRSGRPKDVMPPLMKMPRSCTPWLYVIEGETCEAYLTKWA